MPIWRDRGFGMDEDSASLIVFLAMILPAGLAAGRLAPAPSFLFDALWFSFVFLFTLVTVELGMIVWYARQGDKFDRVTLSLFGLGPLVFGTWPFLAFVVTGLPWDPVVRLAAWFAYVIASIVVL